MSKALRDIARRGGILLGVLAFAVAIGTTRVPAEIESDPPIELEFAPSSLSGSYLAGRMAGSLRDAPAAAAFFRHALTGDPLNPALLERGFTLSLVAGDTEEAMALARRMLEVDEDHRLARLALAVKALRSRQYREARRHLREPGNGPLAELTATLLEGWALAGKGDTEAALETIEALDGPDWFAIFRPDFQAGLIAEAAGDHARAGRYYERAHASEDQVLRIVQARARNLARERRRDEALAVLDGFLENLSRHPLIEANRAEIADGRLPAAIAATPQEGAAEVLYGIGAALGNDNAEEFSAVYLQLALYLAPRHGLAHIALANYFERIEDHALAAETYARIPEGSPLRASAQTHRALNLNDLDRFDEARALLEDVIAANPENREALVAQGNILRSREAFEDATEYYTRAIDLIDTPGRQDWILYYYRGITHERSDRWPRAERDFKQALELEPDQPYVLNYLGYSWIDQDMRLEEALEMIKKAVELRPEDGYIVDSLGWAYYKLERYEEAVEELERAVELRPQDPIINDHLGDAYWMVGRRAEASFQWSHARELDPEPELLEEILEKLESGLDAGPEPERSAAELGAEAD